MMKARPTKEDKARLKQRLKEYIKVAINLDNNNNMSDEETTPVEEVAEEATEEEATE